MPGKSGSPARHRTVQQRLGRSNQPLNVTGNLAGNCDIGHTATSHPVARALPESPHDQPRSAHRPRQLVPASGARRGAHARRRLHGVQGPGAHLRRAARTVGRAAAPRPPVPSAARVRAAQPGAPGVGRRSAFQPLLSRPPHRVAAAGRRGRPQASQRPDLLSGARSQPPAVGAVAGRGTGRRSLRAALKDPSCARRRRLGSRHLHGPVRLRSGSDAGCGARARLGPAAAAE